jgi:hypothetical protein
MRCFPQRPGPLIEQRAGQLFGEPALELPEALRSGCHGVAHHPVTWWLSSR